MENLLWVEKFRPETVEACILPPRLKKPFQEYVKQKEIPNLLLTGGPGVGKTTIAKALCREVGCDYMLLNGSNENGVDIIRYKIKNYASSVSLSGGKKVVIFDEADYLTTPAQAILRNAIEEFSINCSFIFTCNYKSKIIEPIHSRCAVVDFTLKPSEKADIAKQFFGRVKSILDHESVEYDDKVIAEVIKKHFPDFRRVLNELQRYSKFGKIDIGILSQIVNVSIAEIVKHLKDKNFSAIRKWVASGDFDSSSVFRQLYDALYDVMEPSSIPKAVLILADYDYKQAFVVDQEINLVACLTEIMLECNFK